MCVQLLIRSRPILWMSKLRARERKQLTWHTQCETVQPGASYLIIHSPNKFPFIHNIYWHLCNTPFGLPAVKKSACQCRRLRRLGFNPCVGKIPWRRKWQPTAILFFFFFFFYRYSCLGNSVVRGAWRATVCGCKELDKT